MKQIENSNTWKIVLEVIDELVNKEHYSLDLSKEDIRKKCYDLAEYSFERDIENCTISEVELQNMEKEGKNFNSHLFSRLARHYYLQEVIEGKDTSISRVLVETIHAFLGNRYYYVVDSEKIRELCMIGAQYPEKYDSIINQNEFLKRVAGSALYLRNLGIEIEVKEGNIKFDEDLEQKLFDTLDKKIKTVGGNYVLERVFKEYIGNVYMPLLDRYCISRKVDAERNEPINLLIHLSAKHLVNHVVKISSDAREKHIDQIIKFAEALLDICDVQGESGMEYSMLKPSEFPLYLKNEMIFDKMCIPTQYSVKFILKSLDYLIEPWFNDYAKKAYSYKEYCKIAEYILNLNCLGGLLDIIELKRKTKIAQYKVDNILKDIALPLKLVNCEFSSLDKAVNLYTRPLIMFPFGKYFFIDQHFSGIGFYLAAYEMIKKHYDIFDRIQGPYVEKMIIDEMEKKDYRCIYGEYQSKGGLSQDQCDLVLQGKRINFIEIKKKSSTDEFNLIDDIAILKSLAFGMVKGQKQGFAHERYMINNDGIKLTNSKETQLLKYNQNQLPSFKISVCFPEYSFLTSKVFSSTLLEVLMIGSFSSVNESRQKELDKLNNLGMKIRESAISINHGDSLNVRNAAFSSLFCSSQQILTAVWLCENEEEFREVVRDWVYCTDKTLDPYISLIMTREYQINPEKTNVRRSAIEMLERSHPYAMYVG